MILCKVTGSIVSTQKNQTLKEHKILIVQPIDINGNAIGKDVLSLDTLDAGVGDTVLIIQEGSGAQQILKRNDVPVHTITIAIVDGIDISIKD
jgi:microcompartment protein CcmK/EutM